MPDAPSRPISPRDHRMLVGGALSYLPQKAQGVREKYATEPVAGSPAAQEEKKAAGPLRELLYETTALANVRLIAAEDCLASVGLLLGRNAAYAPMPTLRTAAELCARAWWLLEPDISEKDRVRRTLADFWEGLVELRRIPTVSQVPQSFWERVEAHKQLAIRAGIPVATRQGSAIPSVRNQKSSDPRRILSAMVKAAPELVKRTPGYSYRFLSGFAHGEAFALQFLVTPGVDGTATLGVSDELVRQQLLHSGLVMIFYLLAVRRQWRHYGWTDTEPLMAQIRFILNQVEQSRPADAD